jgi:hypothetical protein
VRWVWHEFPANAIRRFFPQGLTRFIDDCRIELDNNAIERSIRPIALNRKNALFAGSDGGAEHWATVAPLIENCKNDMDPLAYLTDVLTRIVNGHPNRDIDQLLPWAYRKQDSEPWPENSAYDPTEAAGQVHKIVRWRPSARHLSASAVCLAPQPSH